MILTGRESVDPSISPHPRKLSSGIHFCDGFGFTGPPPDLDGGKLQELPGNLRSLGLRGLEELREMCHIRRTTLSG